MNYKFIEKFGHFSGNKRLDTSNFEEPENDNEKTKEKWLGGQREIKIKRKLTRWLRNIAKTIDPNKVQIHMVGQSHIDCAWMWRFEQTRKKAQVTFRKAVLHSKMFPNTFRFALSQPLLLEWIKHDNPKLFSHIKEAVKKGNIELVGGSYIEPDCRMPSGEAMIRQRIYGMRFYRDNFGTLPSIEWFLDSFGYNHGLPQILAKSGAKYFWTTKLTWNLNTTFPFVNFWWQGPDGSRILSANFHFDVQVLEDWEKYQIGRRLLKKNGLKIWDYTMDYTELKDHVGEEICPHIGFFFGLSDGGHGPTHKEVAIANELAKLDLFKWSGIKNFFNELKKYSDKFPIWNDELYLENHRGCLSNHADVKRHNRKYENAIVALETLSILTTLINSEYEYPKYKLEALWKTTLKNQFHDVLPGSSIPEVYDEVWDDWTVQDIIIEEIINDVGTALAVGFNSESSHNSTEFFLFNPVAWERKARVFVPISVFKNTTMRNKNGKPKYAKLKLLNQENSEYLCQPIAAEPEDTIERMPAGWWTIIKLNPLSLTPVKLTILNDSQSEEIKKTSNFNVSKDIISNQNIKIKLDPNSSAIVELIAKNINDRNNLLKGNSSNLTFGFLDNVPIQYHAWNLHPQYWEHPIELSNENDVKIRVSELGPIFATLEISRMLRISPVIQKITLFKDLQEVFLEYIADWKQKDIMLKVLYGTSTNAEIGTADETYCAVEFKTNPEVPCDKARYEKICHKYFDLSTPDKKWGLAMLNEGKYAFDVKGGDMRLTMLRACRYPLAAVEAWVNIERAENERIFDRTVPEYSGLGPFKCRYALLPHKGGALKNADGSPNVIVKRKAEEFNSPIIVVPSEKIQTSRNIYTKLDKILLEILTPNIYLGAFKMKEWNEQNTIIARFFEGSGVATTAKIKFNPDLFENISKIKAVDLLERKIDKNFDWNKETGFLMFNIEKFEICTFELNLNY